MTTYEKIKSNRAQLTKSTELAVRRQLYNQSFYDFFQDAMFVLKPNADWKFNFHHSYIAGILQKELFRVHNKQTKTKDYIINVPPSSTKSSIVSICFNAWAWTINPYLSFLCLSNGDDLAIEFATATKDLIESDWYKELYPHIQLRADSQSKSNFKNTYGGFRISQGIQSKVTGYHADFLLLDDPNDSKESLIQMNSVARYYEESITSRVNDYKVSSVMVIMQRLAEGDLTGSILGSPNADNYEHICLPVEHGDNIKPSYLGQYYREGNLWPERFPINEQKYLGKTLQVYTTQYLQRAGAIEGGKIKKEWLEVVDNTPSIDYHLFIDTAFGKKGGDSTAIMVAGIQQNIMYVKKVYDLNLEFPDLLKKIKEVVEADTNSKTVKIYIEPKANGISIVQTLKRETLFNVMELKQHNDNKITKVDAITPKLESGRVRLVRGNWNNHFLDQCVLFPNAKNDDMVDTLQMAVSTLLNGSGRLNWYM